MSVEIARRLGRLCAGLALVALCTAGAAAQPQTAAPPRARLSGDVVPVAYDLTVAPDLETMRTAGSETIEVDVRRPVDAIIVNARAIRVEATTIDGAAARTDAYPAVQQLRIRSAAPIAVGRHHVTLAFASVIHTAGDRTGLFLNIGPEEGSLTTLFEPSTARSMFPCFDEPQFRARFTLHVRAPRRWTVVSNMPLHEQRDAGADLVWNDFDPSPPMPAYALTLDAGTFVHVDGTSQGVPMRVFVRPGQEQHARTMLADAERILPFYERFFGVPFPLAKLDLVVGSGGLQTAFEGWGAITFYSEAAPFGLQYDGGDLGRREAVRILAHEMAHQWTGDLVTMRWWRDTFVSEGLAQFAQREATRSVFPELETWRDDDREVGYLMGGGIGAKAQPVLTPVLTDLEAEDNGVFNVATYQKGASVLGGWRDAVGDDAFHAGLRRYLRRFAFGSASFEDFWRELGGAEGVAYGHAWLAQRGFPVVDVRASCARGRMTVVASQQAFVSDPHIDPAYRAQRWPVPLLVQSGAWEHRFMLHAHAAPAQIGDCRPFLVNAGTRPYYLVRYDDAAYGRLAQGAGSLGERDRAGLYRDAVMLHAAGALSDLAYVRLIVRAREPLDADVWTMVAREYRRMDQIIRDVPEAPRFAELQRRALLGFARRYGAIHAKERGPFRLGYDADWALAATGDPISGAAFHADYLAMLDDAPAIDFQAIWPTAMIAGAVATSDDVERTEAKLRTHPSGPSTVVSVEVLFLQNVGDERLAGRVLGDAMADGRLTQDQALAFLFAFGNRHPRLAYAYLRGHVRELKKAIPPTQQAWTVSMGAATSLWPATAPRELRAFLRAEFPSDRATVDRAVALSEKFWAERRTLAAAVRALPREDGR